jgi:hypothetical protein
MTDRAVAEQISAHMRGAWPEEEAHRLVSYAERLLYAVQGYDVLPSLYALADIAELCSTIAGDVIDVAGKETTIPAKRLAEALNVPPSTLRGLRAKR